MDFCYGFYGNEKKRLLLIFVHIFCLAGVRSLLFFFFLPNDWE